MFSVFIYLMILLFVYLIMILHQLNDNPYVVRVVLDGNHSHDVGRIFSVRILAVFVGQNQTSIRLMYLREQRQRSILLAQIIGQFFLFYFNIFMELVLVTFMKRKKPTLRCENQLLTTRTENRKLVI